MKISFIIVAAGVGSRIGGELPKQFLPLTSKGVEMPIILHTLNSLAQSCEQLGYQSEYVVVLHRDFVEYFQQLCQRYSFTAPYLTAIGGDSRFESVKNGLRTLIQAQKQAQQHAQQHTQQQAQGQVSGSANATDELIAVHDSVRPYVSIEVLESAVKMALAKGAAVPSIELTDSIRMIDDNSLSRALDRSLCRLVQTPQVFQSQLIINAYNQPYCESFTDDASVVERSGVPIFLSQGAKENIKITYPSDLESV